jgi:photosystem II stability/assembly factor-like uncharacterized protein
MKIKKIFILALLLPLLTGCSIKFSGGTKADNGGIYLSGDKGNGWQGDSALLGGAAANFMSANVKFLIMDPTDNQALYAGTDKALYYTYNGAKGWQATLNDIGSLNTIAIDETNHCVLYTSIGNRLYKSTDCARHWNYTLIEENSTNKNITAIAVEKANPKNIYIGTAAGGLFKSEDAGNSWKNIKYFDNPIKKLIISTTDPKIMYVVTTNGGIMKTIDGTISFADLTVNIQKAMDDNKIDKNCGNVKEYRVMIIDPANESHLLYASRCLFDSQDRGENWQQIKLLTRPQETNIFGLAISYQNNREIFYSSNTTFYRTDDNGANWTTKDLPSLRASSALLTDPVNPNLLYLALGTPTN